MTDAQETIGTVLLLGAPLAVITWPLLPLLVIHVAAAGGLTLGLGVVAYLAVHWLYGFAAGIAKLFGGDSR